MSNIYIQEPPASGKVVIKTSVGDLDVELWAKETPKACRNFIQLCLEGYYNNTIFHRVVKGFIVQGGDPTGTGEGGESIYGETFKDEFHSRLRFVRRGLLAMANSGKDDNGSQFFFTLAPTPELQNKHTIFGKIAGETIYNMLKLEDAMVDENDRPIYPQKILKTEVLNNPFSDIVPRVVPGKTTTDDKAKKKRKKGVKDFKLLSFGEEAEEDEEESTVLNKTLSVKSKSAHDVLTDPKLSSQPVIETGPSSKKLKKADPESDSENSVNGDDNDKFTMDKETGDMSDKEKNMLDEFKNNLKMNIQKKKAAITCNNDEAEEEFYFGKERDDEQKRKTKEVKKQIRDFKREIKAEQNKKLDEEKQKAENKKKEEARNEIIKELQEEQEEMKKIAKSHPKKGVSRDNFVQSHLKDFLNTMSTSTEQQTVKEIEDKEEEDEDTSDMSWLNVTLKSKDEELILAKDANMKGDDWFDIYDPRNPINKRRRGETTGKNKFTGNSKNEASHSK